MVPHHHHAPHPPPPNHIGLATPLYRSIINLQCKYGFISKIPDNICIITQHKCRNSLAWCAQGVTCCDYCSKLHNRQGSRHEGYVILGEQTYCVRSTHPSGVKCPRYFDSVSHHVCERAALFCLGICLNTVNKWYLNKSVNEQISNECKHFYIHSNMCFVMFLCCFLCMFV